jgi:hypothetical protein
MIPLSNLVKLTESPAGQYLERKSLFTVRRARKRRASGLQCATTLPRWWLDLSMLMAQWAFSPSDEIVGTQIVATIFAWTILGMKPNGQRISADII